MLVSLSGGSKKERDIAEKVVSFCIKRLLPRARKLEIEVAFEKDLDAFGYCEMEGTNREFTLTLRKGLSLMELIQTTCHEMVHVKQYYRDEMEYCGPRGTRWKSKFFKKEGSFPPWEKEAYKMEKPLSYKFLEQVDLKV